MRLSPQLSWVMYQDKKVALEHLSNRNWADYQICLKQGKILTGVALALYRSPFLRNCVNETLSYWYVRF